LNGKTFLSIIVTTVIVIVVVDLEQPSTAEQPQKHDSKQTRWRFCNLFLRDRL